MPRTRQIAQPDRCRGLTPGMLLLMSVACLMLAGAGQPALALQCGPGAGWVAQCPAGVDRLLQTSSILDVSLLTPQGPLHFPHLTLSGPTEIHRGRPAVDSNGHAFIPMTLERHLAVTIPGLGSLTLANTGSGRIIEQQDDAALAESFFDLFLDLNLNGRALHSAHSVHAEADRLLIGLPVDTPPFSPPPIQSCDPEASNTARVALVFCAQGPVDILDASGNTAAIVHSARLVVHPVPEPSTLYMFGTVLVGGMALGLRRKRCTPAPAGRLERSMPICTVAR